MVSHAQCLFLFLWSIVSLVFHLDSDELINFRISVWSGMHFSGSGLADSLVSPNALRWLRISRSTHCVLMTDVFSLNYEDDGKFPPLFTELLNL